MATRIASLLCACVFFTGFAEAGTDKESNTGKQTENSITAPPASNSGISEMACLLADNVKVTDKKKLSDYTKAINESLGYDHISEEDLMFPSIDLYGQGSWRSDAVNPFIGGLKPQVPDSFAVNLTQFVYPLDEVKRVTSRYGYRRRYRRMHYGIDISLRVGDTIRAAFDGKVRMIDYEGRGYGHYVVIRHTNGLETVYAHNSRILAKEDQIVRAGDPIALGGSTGRSTGPHLHFEARFLGQPINPEHLINFASGIPKSDSYLYVSKGGRSNSSGSSNVQARSGAPERDAAIKVHKIRKGDTLSGIASQYGTTVSQLCKINNISRRTTLRVGRTLRVTS